VAFLDQHPTVVAVRNRAARPAPDRVAGSWLREVCLAAGADDVGFVAIDRDEIAADRPDILRTFPATKALISIVCRMNREPVRNPNRSVANLEFHHTGDHVNDAAREIVRVLEAEGIRAMNAPMGFPMEATKFPGKIWVVSHKPVAVAAGLGQMGIHRNVIHPRFGSFILLGTVLLVAEVDEESKPVSYDPCVSCKLCVAACPVGAIKPDGRFDASACLTHNYREFLNGFTDWVETVADSRDAKDYRSRVTDQGGFVAELVKPLQQKEETVYVVAESDAEAHVTRAFPHKTPKRVTGIRPSTIEGFLDGLKIVFQAGKAKDIDAVYHLIFTGAETAEATVTIRSQSLDVQRGLVGTPDCTIRADAATWLGFLRKERSIVWAIMRGKVRVIGGLSRLKDFGRCFPG
jgi:NAD-dependent dihydropyrimidine dehydrogenase PreA subunit